MSFLYISVIYFVVKVAFSNTLSTLLDAYIPFVMNEA